MRSVVQDQPVQALPQCHPRQGFAALPGREQLVVCVLVAIALLAFYPSLLDPARMRRATAIKAGLKPQMPPSATQFAARLENHYALGWLLVEDSSRERKTRLVFTSVQLGTVMLGAAAGRHATRPRRHGGAPLHLAPPNEATPATVRARSALIPH